MPRCSLVLIEISVTFSTLVSLLSIKSFFLSSYWRQELSTHHTSQLGGRDQHGVEAHKYGQCHSSRRAAYESYS